MDRRTEFLYASILDAQLTIRALDIKAGFLFVLLFAPIIYLDRLGGLYTTVMSWSACLRLAILVDVLVWLLSVISLFMSVGAISNPIKHIAGSKNSGVFYGGDMFSLTWIDIFFNCRNTSIRTVQDEVLRIPEQEEALISELTFEKMKLDYIRSMKTKRSVFCFYSTLVWVIIGAALAIWVAS